MNFRKARAVRRKVSSLVKGKLMEFVANDKLFEGEVVRFKDEPNFHSHWTESTVVEEVLLYWVRDFTVNGPTAMVAGYECGRGGIGRCLFCIWWVDSDGRWDIKVHDVCPTYLGLELENFIEEVNNEKEENEEG